MKNKILRILSLALAVTTAFSTSIPVFAYDVDEHDNSVESVEYQNTENEDFTNTANVFAQLGSEYKVTIPKVVVLSGATKDARYYVKVAGDIAGYEKVNVIPEDSFKLSAKNKADETATISQDKTVWTVHDFDTDANGLIQASSITAGKWKGTFNFNINLENNFGEIPENIKILDLGQFEDVKNWSTNNSKVVNLESGDTSRLFVTFKNEDVTDDVSLTSSNEEVIKVENNELLAQNVGTSLITMSLDNEKISKTQTFLAAVTDENTPACDHKDQSKLTQIIENTEPTCTKDGASEFTIICNNCGQIVDKKKITMQATGHVYNLGGRTDVISPTCTEPGSYTSVTGCMICGEGYELIPNQYIAPLGHNFVNGTCTRCGFKGPEYGITVKLSGEVSYKLSNTTQLSKLEDLNKEIRPTIYIDEPIGGRDYYKAKPTSYYATYANKKIYIDANMPVSSFMYTSENSGYWITSLQKYTNIINNGKKITITNNQKIYFIMPEENIEINISNVDDTLYINGVEILVEGTACEHEFKSVEYEGNCAVPGESYSICTKCHQMGTKTYTFVGSPNTYDLFNVITSIKRDTKDKHNFVDGKCTRCNAQLTADGGYERVYEY